ncbi:uncharacterized protein LOC111713222 [Eurytemora carolleeae]|uniref:uncharacterized protein LOC111713222 n=1 Tax=Eurytemora carolleeae TaxID=1294199 RepID=UPI000C75BED8|nr:uncharacterized protein LOC111713222 [Eurytemora carolleeae]|eukprot:XP_023343814.1 uncharacterized protein LOC111713222 [Eurytemora affinis]
MSKDDEPEETYRLSPNQTLRTLLVGEEEETRIDEETTTWDPEDTTYWFNHDTSDSGQTWNYAGRAEIPIWVLVIVSFLLSSGFILYMKVFQPEAWNKMAACCKSGKLFSKPNVSTRDLRRWRCPKMAAPSSSCMSKRGTCWKGICCVSSSRRTNDMCFLCLNDVPNKEWETHRRVCALRNQDKLDNLSSPSPVPCFRCNKFLRALPSYPVTSFICDREGCVHKGQHLNTKTYNRYNCYLCDFDLCSDCVNCILENTGNQERKSEKSVDEVEIVSIHHQTREIEYVEDDIPDSSLAYLTPNDSESSSTRQTRKVSKKTSTCSVEIGIQTTAFPHYRTTSFPQ